VTGTRLSACDRGVCYNDSRSNSDVTVLGAASVFTLPLYASVLREFHANSEGVRRIKASNPLANPSGIRTPFVGGRG
jgi:hypothetical protein